MGRATLKALAQVAAHLPNCLKVAPRLQTFGHGKGAEAMSSFGLCTRQKAARPQDPVLGVAASDQPLRTGKSAGVEIDLGLVPYFEPAAMQGFVEVDRGGGTASLRVLGPCIDPTLGKHFADRFRTERLAERRQHIEFVALAHASNILQYGLVAAAHQLDEAAIAMLVQFAEHVDCVRSGDRNIKEDDCGRRVRQST